MKMSEMIQMIAALSEMRNQREQRALESQRLAQEQGHYDTEQHQWQQQFGLGQKQFDLATQESHVANLEHFRDYLVNGTDRSRQDDLALRQSYGVTDAEFPGFQQLASDLPMTAATAQNQAITQGLHNAPVGDVAAWDREAASRATSGQTTEQLMRDDFSRQLFGGASQRLASMTPQQRDPYFVGLMTDMTHPLEGAWEGSILGSQGGVAATAGIHYGYLPTWIEDQTTALQKFQLKLASAQGLGPLTAPQRMEALGKIVDAVHTAAMPGVSDSGREIISGAINNLGAMIGYHGPIVPDPHHIDANSTIQQLHQNFTGWSMPTPSYGAPSQQGAPAPSAPATPTATAPQQGTASPVSPAPQASVPPIATTAAPVPMWNPASATPGQGSDAQIAAARARLQDIDEQLANLHQAKAVTQSPALDSMITQLQAERAQIVASWKGWGVRGITQ